MSCLFNSLSRFVSDSSENIRKNICDYLLTNPKLYDEISASDYINWESGKSLNDYVKQMRSSSTWGGAIEISAFTHLYAMNVNVLNIRDSGNYTIIKPIEFKSNQKTNKSCTISWNGFHYEPI